METKTYAIPDAPYQALKWAGLVACPALATFVGAVGPAWGWPQVDAIVLTLNAAGVLVGALIGVTTATAKTAYATTEPQDATVKSSETPAADQVAGDAPATASADTPTDAGASAEAEAQDAYTAQLLAGVQGMPTAGGTDE
ncbi:MAG: phage holin [Parafannyhessea sp.]|uniref:phage holin n=1 Tax=Parafannyhessea sp. TaxID=2847324 RepID=UPI003EFF20E6